MEMVMLCVAVVAVIVAKDTSRVTGKFVRLPKQV